MFDEAIKLNLIIAEMRSGNLNKMAAPSADFFFFIGPAIRNCVWPEQTIGGPGGPLEYWVRVARTGPNG